MMLENRLSASGDKLPVSKLEWFRLQIGNCRLIPLTKIRKCLRSTRSIDSYRMKVLICLFLTELWRGLLLGFRDHWILT